MRGVLAVGISIIALIGVFASVGNAAHMRRGWWWSERTAEVTLGTSPWAINHNIDRYLIDCVGVGPTWRPKGKGPILYQVFRCRSETDVLASVTFRYLHRLTITGRDSFRLVQLAKSVSPS